MNRTLKMFAALAPLVAFAPVAAQSNANAPVVAVLVFENGSFGKDKADFDGIGKGIADMMIVNLASSGKVRVVERTNIQRILEEQKLTKEGAVDAQTAVRIGRIVGACYSVIGSFTRNSLTGENVLIVRTMNNETSVTENPIMLPPSKSDDILGLISQAATKFVQDMKVSACPGTAGTRRSGDASPAAAQQQASTPAPAATVAPAHVEYAKVLKPDEIKKVQSNKLDARTMLIYSRALDAKDRKDNARAKQLAQQVLDKYKDFSPAKDLIAAASAGN